MKEPIPSKPVPIAPRKDAQPARPTGTPPGRLERPLKVRFYCSMKPQRVYPLTVEFQPGPARPAPAVGMPVNVRPVIPGALVVPAEQRLDAAQPGVKATFHITPLARGRLPDPRVELDEPGQSAGQVRLRMKSVTQRRTWVLAVLTLLVPWFITAVTHESSPYRLRGNVNPKLPDLASDPGEVLRDKLVTWAKDSTPLGHDLGQAVVDPVAQGLGYVYNWACNLAPDYLYFWVGVGLFGLTLVSWVANRSQRASRRKVVLVTAAAPAVAAAETLPLTPREQAPALARPVE